MNLRTIRAVVLTALTWGVAWAVVGALIAVFDFVRVPPENFDLFDLRYISLKPVRGLGVAGMLAGATFAAVMSQVERGETLETITLRRAAIWGAIGGLGFAMVLGALVVGDIGSFVNWWLRAAAWTTVAAVCGAVSAAGSLAIARKGTPGVLEEAEAMQRIAGP